MNKQEYDEYDFLNLEKKVKLEQSHPAPEEPIP